MKIEAWSDVACPFCYIAKRHLENAIKALDIGHEVTIIWRSFQLDPDAPTHTDLTNDERLAAKYGRDVQWAREMNENVKETAAGVGLKFDMQNIKPSNTFTAHRLIHLAKEANLQDKMKEALMAAYFEKGLNVSDHNELKKIAAEAGLNAQRVNEVLEGEEFAAEVRADMALADTYGITAVPFFLINDKYAIIGAQPTRHFIDTLDKIRNK